MRCYNGDSDSTRGSTSMVIGELSRLGGSCSAKRILSDLYCTDSLGLPFRKRELVARDDDFSDGECRQMRDGS